MAPQIMRSPRSNQIRPLADIVHSKYALTYLVTYLLRPSSNFNFNPIHSPTPNPGPNTVMSHINLKFKN